MISALKKSYNKIGATVYSPYADIILGIFFYLEAIFFLPTDPLLIAYCIERRDNAYYYATIATIASVIGGLCSYLLGYLLWIYCGNQLIYNEILNYFIAPKTFISAIDLYQRYAWGAIFIAGFTPVPFKAATFAAGFCSIPLLPFVIGSIVARGSRFFLYAVSVRLWGSYKADGNHYSNYIMVLLLGIGVLAFFYMRYW